VSGMTRGLLASATRLDRWLQVSVVVLLASCAWRYAARHRLDLVGWVLLAGAVLLAVAYLARPVLTRRIGAVGWVALVVVSWAALTLAAPSYAWAAVPLAFSVLQVLPYRAALAVVVSMTIVVGVGWSRIVDWPDPTVVVGPVTIAIVTVIAYRALQEQLDERQLLVDELLTAQADLAVAERRSGALEERARLSRELHDSVGQHLSSIAVLLRAVEGGGSDSRELVRTAATMASEGLDEVRRVVRDLAPVGVDESADSLPAALRHSVSQVAAHGGPSVEVFVHGVVRPVPTAIASAVVRTARGALANVVDHAGATRAAVTLTYLPDELRLDVRDDGSGMPLAPAGARGTTRGHGLAGIRERAASLGGSAVVESVVGEGTTVTLALPLTPAVESEPSR